MSAESEIPVLLGEAKRIAKEYRRITGRPLGITGEIAEYEAARLLDIELSPVRQAGFDAIRRTPDKEERLQIKGRCILQNAKPGQRLGRLDLEKKWDAALMVLLNEDLEAIAIYEADRGTLEEALHRPGSRARNERGALAVSKFKAVGRKIWPEQ